MPVLLLDSEEGMLSTSQCKKVTIVPSPTKVNKNLRKQCYMSWCKEITCMNVVKILSVTDVSHIRISNKKRSKQHDSLFKRREEIERLFLGYIAKSLHNDLWYCDDHQLEKSKGKCASCSSVEGHIINTQDRNFLGTNTVDVKSHCNASKNHENKGTGEKIVV